MGSTGCGKFVAVWSCVALALAAALGFAPQAFADEAAVAADSGIITIQATPQGANSNGWSASVSYAKPVAGAPAQFTITADGGPNGSGSYQYQQGFIYKYDPYVWVFDPSFGASTPYQDSNVLSYQFVGAGRYDYQFQVRDTQTNLYQRFAFTIDVEGEGFIDADERAREIVAECLPEGNVDDYETALVLHDWIIDNVSYDYTYRNLGVDRALAGMAVTCEGYHAAYVKLLETAGLKTGRITDGGHVWTAVQMDGDWYHVDTTHDDVKDSLSDVTVPGTLSKDQQAHLLFGLDDATMMLANPSYTGPTAGYEANSLENNYFIRTGDILEWSDPIADQILQKLNQKVTSFKLKAANAAWPQPTYKNPINNLVAYELNRCTWSTDNQASDAIVRVGYADDYFNVEAFAVLSGAPSVASSLTYNGSSQVGVAVPDAGKYVVSGTARATNAGTYTATVTPAAGYAWDEAGNREPRSYRWSIAPVPLSSSKVTLSGIQPSYDYTGAAVKPAPQLTYNGAALRNGVDYTVSYASNVNAGTATVTITGKGNFQGIRKAAFSIKGSSASAGSGQPPATGGTADKPASTTKPSAPTATESKAAWKKSGSRWWYRHADGTYTRDGWERINGAWYHFDKAGWMQTGWLKTGGRWYYLSSSGAMKTGWLKTGGTWYYLRSSGAMATGWYKVGGTWYWSNSSGAMGASRWVGNYYLKASGAMATNQWIGRYHVNASGLWDKTR